MALKFCKTFYFCSCTVSGRKVILKLVNSYRWNVSLLVCMAPLDQLVLRKITGITSWASTLAYKNTYFFINKLHTVEIQHGTWLTDLSLAAVYRTKCFSPPFNNLVFIHNRYITIDYRESRSIIYGSTVYFNQWIDQYHFQLITCVIKCFDYMGFL